MQRRILAIGIATILVLTLFVGTAFALRQEPADPLTQILQILLGIRPQVQNTNNEVNTLYSAQPNSLIINKSIALDDTNSRYGEFLLPLEEGKTYSGHMSIRIFCNNNFTVWITNYVPLVDIGGGNLRGNQYQTLYNEHVTNTMYPYDQANVEFTGQALEIEVATSSIDGRSDLVLVEGVIQYQNCTNVNILPQIDPTPKD